MSRTHNYLGTFFTSDDYHLEQTAMVLFADTCKYFVCQAEVCPQTKRRHIQFYCHMSHAKSLTALRKSLTDVDDRLSTCHLEAARGTSQECITYCTKQASQDTQLPWSYEQGEKPKQGKRKDLDDFVKEILEGQVPSLRILVQDYASIVARYPRFVNTVVRLRLQDYQYIAPPLVYVLHGPTGSGKTRFVHSFSRSHFHQNPYTFIHTGSNRLWFDGLDSHPVVLYDEFSGQSIHYNRLKQLTDRYTQLVEVKGGTTVYLPSVIFICTNARPPIFAGAYPDARSGDIDALLRRVTATIDTSVADWQQIHFPRPYNVLTPVLGLTDP